MFFVSTAPLSGDGHVNVSPKGGKYFGVLDRKTFWYQELTGSGNETISHIYEPGNNRVTIMLNAFEGPPRIMRLFGHGRVIENGAPGFDEFVKAQKVDCIPGTRSIIIVDIHQVGTSCGFSVPYYDFKDYRPILNDFFKKKAEREAAGHASDSMPRYLPINFFLSMNRLTTMQILGQQERVVDGRPPRDQERAAYDEGGEHNAFEEDGGTSRAYTLRLFEREVRRPAFTACCGCVSVRHLSLTTLWSSDRKCSGRRLACGCEKHVRGIC
jgi:hypothetical protein